MASIKIADVLNLVRPGITGYLAAPEDTQDFDRGIQKLFDDATICGQMSQNCRAIALEEYPLRLQAQRRYVELINKFSHVNLSLCNAHRYMISLHHHRVKAVGLGLKRVWYSLAGRQIEGNGPRLAL